MPKEIDVTDIKELTKYCKQDCIETLKTLEKAKEEVNQQIQTLEETLEKLNNLNKKYNDHL